MWCRIVQTYVFIFIDCCVLCSLCWDLLSYFSCRTRVKIVGGTKKPLAKTSNHQIRKCFSSLSFPKIRTTFFLPSHCFLPDIPH